MSAEEVLRSSERSALNNNQIVSHVVGKNPKLKSPKKLKSFGVMGFITLIIVLFFAFFSSGNLIPSAISERLIEETDVQYTDAVESKKLVFQQAMFSGELPDDTASILKQRGVEVGYINNEGDFEEGNKTSTELVLRMNNEIITANDFIEKVSSDVKLYEAFNDATYSRAAYYYDESAKKVFKKIGTTRNNYSADSDFDEVMESLMGKGSDIDVNNVETGEKGNDENEESETTQEYIETGKNTSSNTSAATFINEVGNKNRAATSNEATLNSADTLKVADTISKEQRSSLFFLTFMENISKMKAGKGNDSQINEAMNYIHESKESEIVDINTGEVIKTFGTPLDSPSLYAILSGEKIDTNAIKNYSSDRVLKTVENQLGDESGAGIIRGTVASSSADLKGSIGRFLGIGSEKASIETLNVVNKTIDSSLVNNSYSTIKGVNAGEFLVEGAINVGKALAKASGATAGDSTAVTKYAKLNASVLAMDAEVDRKNRSPFDITSKNTFLGSIVYNLAIINTRETGTFSSVIKSFSSLISNSATALMGNVYADEPKGYLSTFGDCKTYKTIGVVGSAQCAEIMTFDTSTLEGIFDDPGFKAFVEENTTMSSSGSRQVNKNSTLANFILYNNERTTPLGVTDGGILNSLKEGTSSVSFATNILEMIKTFLGASDNDKQIASGAAYVNSQNNINWQTYKYAQRYVSLARATSALKQYSTDKTAYTNIKYFEGEENPIIAFLEEYYQTASR